MIRNRNYSCILLGVNMINIKFNARFAVLFEEAMSLGTLSIYSYNQVQESFCQLVSSVRGNRIWGDNMFRHFKVREINLSVSCSLFRVVKSEVHLLFSINKTNLIKVLICCYFYMILPLNDLFIFFNKPIFRNFKEIFSLTWKLFIFIECLLENIIYMGKISWFLALRY